MVHITAAAIREVLEEAMVEFHRISGGAIEFARKTDGSIVSRVDLGLDAFLRQRLHALAPEAAWLSEESAADVDRLTRPWAWVVDPLDGSGEFARGIPEFAISIGLVERGVVRAGGVVNPVARVGAACGVDRSWIAWPETVRGPVPRDLASATACVSRTESEDGSIAPYVDLVGQTRLVGSAAFKLLRVASGLDDITFSVQGKSEWDICGGVALLAARGLSFVCLDDRPVLFNQARTRFPGGFAAGPPALANTLADRLRARKAAIGRIHA